MLAALAEAGLRLERDDWLARARELAEFLLGAALAARTGGCIAPTASGRRRHAGVLEDYADVAHGLLELHAADGDARWLAEARRLALLAADLFADDERGGFWLTPVDGERLVARTKSFDDHPTPSGNSMLAYVLLRLARIDGDAELERRAAGVLRLVRDTVTRAPTSFGHALCALDLYLSPPRELAIVGPARGPATRELAGAALAEWQPEHGRRLVGRRRRRDGPGGRAARRQGSRRRPPGGLPVRELRVPGTRHGPAPAQRAANKCRLESVTVSEACARPNDHIPTDPSPSARAA